MIVVRWQASGTAGCGSAYATMLDNVCFGPEPGI
jgi:hypothetical protein